MENRPDQISAISGLRILAAWMIFLHHYRFELGLSADSMLLMLMTELHVGVAVFFVSSGFLCAYNYHYKLRSKHFSFRDFIYKRWARLYPLYLTLLLAGLYLHEFTVIVLLSHLTLTHGFIISHIFTLFPQTWALTVMFCFYCTISLIDQVLGRTWKSAIYIPLLLICTSCIIALVLSQLSSYSFNEIMNFELSYTFLGRSFEFVIGYWVGIQLTKGTAFKYLKENLSFFGILVFVSLIIVIAQFQSESTPYGMMHPFGMILHHFILPLSIVCILAGLTRETNSFTQILSGKFFGQLGKASYAFYLIHIGFIAEIVHFKISSVLWVKFIILNLIAWIIYYTFEKTILKHLLRIRPKRNTTDR